MLEFKPWAWAIGWGFQRLLQNSPWSEPGILIALSLPQGRGPKLVCNTIQRHAHVDFSIGGRNHHVPE